MGNVGNTIMKTSHDWDRPTYTNIYQLSMVKSRGWWNRGIVRSSHTIHKSRMLPWRLEASQTCCPGYRGAHPLETDQLPEGRRHINYS